MEVTFRSTALTGQNIICFAKDWSENPTSNNHVMVELSKSNRVLWLNSIGMRAPNLTKARDIKRIFGKLGRFFQGPKQVGPNLWVHSPIVLPLPHSRLAAAINRQVLRWTVRSLRRKLGMSEFQLWTFLPNAAEYVGTLNESLVVYYCVDEWTGFGNLDGKRIAEAENRLLARADLVFATAQSLVDSRRKVNPRTYLARHGVRHDLFSAALDDKTVIPDDVASLPRPVIGYFGTIQEWMDQDLLVFLATRHPEWAIVLIGHPAIDVAKLRSCPNIHMLGRKPHHELPSYCKAMAVGLIPQKVNDLTLHMNPIKLREYLSAGLPVVATALPEAMGYASHCRVASSYEEFEHHVLTALTEDSPGLRKERSELMAGETWARRAAEIGDRVMSAKNGRILGF